MYVVVCVCVCVYVCVCVCVCVCDVLYHTTSGYGEPTSTGIVSCTHSQTPPDCLLLSALVDHDLPHSCEPSSAYICIGLSAAHRCMYIF